MDTILIVDDEVRNRDLLRAFLGGSYRLLEAASGEEALQLAAQQPVDLVLLDVMMPGRDGYVTCAELKARAQEHFLPVILITSLGDLAHRNLGWQAGADDFLAKPVDRQELLHRVRALLRLRAQEILIHGQVQKLRDLQALKDETLSLLVHDMRAPLCGLMAYLHLFLENAQGQLFEDAQAAMQAADAIRYALEDMLQIRLIEERRLPVVRAQVELAEIVSSVQALLEPGARRRRIAVDASVEGGPAALVDGKLVRRALENLVLNALRYTPEGSDVQIRAAQVGGVVSFEVGDRGPGVPAALRDGLFDKFASLEERRGGQRKGFGLGLYLVRLVCEGHGGRVEVIDRPGGGALFRMIWPAQG